MKINYDILYFVVIILVNLLFIGAVIYTHL